MVNPIQGPFVGDSVRGPPGCNFDFWSVIPTLTCNSDFWTDTLISLKTRPCIIAQRFCSKALLTPPKLCQLHAKLALASCLCFALKVQTSRTNWTQTQVVGHRQAHSLPASGLSRRLRTVTLKSGCLQLLQQTLCCKVLLCLHALYSENLMLLCQMPLWCWARKLRKLCRMSSVEK